MWWREHSTRLPSPVTTSSAWTVSTWAPTFCMVPPVPPTLSVPPIERCTKSVSIGGVSPTAAAASSSSDHVTPASTSAHPSSMPWMVRRRRASMAMPPGTSAWPKLECDSNSSSVPLWPFMAMVSPLWRA